jgi:hypothetical protein
MLAVRDLTALSLNQLSALDIETPPQRHCQLEQSERDFRRFASAIHQVACDWRAPGE